MKPAPSIVIMAGGTGGHVFPALAVAEKLRQRGATLNWLGTARGLEAEVAPAAGIRLHCLTIEGVRGKGLLALLKAPFLLLRAVWQARHILKSLRADAVLGLGGFASGPGGVAAWLLRKPLLIHEQNAIAGTTNRWLARIANRVLVAFPEALPGGSHVGNPVRDNIAAVTPLQIETGQPLHLLVLGGSLGAMALNQLLPEALAQIDSAERPQVRHQCGRRHVEATRAAYREHGVEAEILPFVDDMAAAYQWASVVICRAGALTVSELTLAGRAALLVPYPHAIDDHQTANAAWLRDNGAAELVQQTALTADSLAGFIRTMQREPGRLQNMADRARALAMPEAANQVADCCEQLAREHLRRVANG